MAYRFVILPCSSTKLTRPKYSIPRQAQGLDHPFRSLQKILAQLQSKRSGPDSATTNPLHTTTFLFTASCIYKMAKFIRPMLQKMKENALSHSWIQEGAHYQLYFTRSPLFDTTLPPYKEQVTLPVCHKSCHQNLYSRYNFFGMIWIVEHPLQPYWRRRCILPV